MNCKSNCPKLPWMVDFNSNEAKEILDNQYEAAFAQRHMEYLSKLNMKSRPNRFRCTQLVCLITPNTPITTMVDLLTDGMTVAMVCAHKTEKCKEIISKLRTLVEGYSRRIGRVYPLGVALEIKGPEIRIGALKGSSKKIFLEKGKVTKLTTQTSYEEFVCADMIYVDYEKLPEVVQPGDKVVLDNGSVTLTALECVESIIRCIVEKAGMLVSRASVTVPNAIVDVPKLSATDRELMKMAVTEAVDYLFVSGIQNKQSILDVKDLLGLSGDSIYVIAKIDNYSAVENIDEIIKCSDGIFVDCERMLTEMPKEKIFLVQKSISAKCNLAGKPVIVTASISDPRCLSKAEISDLSNVIMEGCDALLLPREANNREMLKSVTVICKEAEPAVHQKHIFDDLLTNFPAPMEPIYSLVVGVVQAEATSKAAAIICLTSSGRTAKLISRFKPRCPIIVITRYPRVARMLSIYRGVEALLYVKPFCGHWHTDVDNRIQLGVTYGKYIGYIRSGDIVITIMPSRPECGLPNTMRILYASEFDTLPVNQSGEKKMSIPLCISRLKNR
ncbi:unnamed protein product [Psylliodes chrysocephalus]|uniref:Pyruvate kinase n=1 Tax=Psylliodes chrysocephalus TaxID=3402493 RepID=A0A9P0GHW0_9CUCU|nr:unnamed protein product [Psylliodes chrysocephala]